MNALHQLAEKVRRGEPLPLPLSLLLLSATPVVRLGMWARLRGSRARVNAKVISIGNITAGGTGKTPAVIECARTELAAGKRVAILTRGYGAHYAETLTVLEGGHTARRASDLVGDEAALIGSKLPGAIIVRAIDRVAAARVAIDRHHCDTLILDDGFQYVRLERDENIVVIDATNPFGNGHLIPRGILREPITALKRATAIILTRCDQVANVSPILTKIDEVCPGMPVRKTRHAPVALWRVTDGIELPLEHVRGKEVTAVCAIGNPEAFFATLTSLGAIVVERRTYPDHAIIPAKALPPEGIVVITEKDAMRMRPAGENVLALGIELAGL